MLPLIQFLSLLAGLITAPLLALALVLTYGRRLGPPGDRLARFAQSAPGLDLVVSLFTWVPWLTGWLAANWLGLLAALAAQAVTLLTWTAVHEVTHPRARRGPRIIKALNRYVGTWRNHAALWVTMIALPAFLVIRLMQVLAYPLLVLLLGFPRYRHAEWINVSRQKFEGLIGHDLIWCLYCDWMTGVYSLGGEMLRNVESFWCPIRFYDGKKCDNCRIDFPDIDGGWAPATGSMADVERVLDTHYAGGRREWFGHPARLTIERRIPAPPGAQ